MRASVKTDFERFDLLASKDKINAVQEVYQNTRESKPVSRDNSELREIFKNMLDDKTKKINESSRISRLAIKQYLQKRY